MTPTMHKVLVHGSKVIKEAVLPIGQLSEEVAEARNKHFRMYRERFSRKFNRNACNRDVLNRLLLTSDPFMSCSKRKCKKQKKPFSSEALQLFLPEAYEEIMESDRESEEDGKESEEEEL